ncbi:hypothetical protein MAC_02363 [Metarhizium acridum CQMa 102]|uniref:Zn(2)-C6 fungal-type domain-containing protein n=1 Tax=Metarhizium acridum (strain CQMa 102) TaxID=655827 RepID=E9DXL5_METAQ|nr:uncharacterized protein MAC_02363 [Metarhizium acridum CQMa 102]EFY91478.1 hypothetical protein MAC_02363 [Metarhizium acridum CQMa 102]
MTKCSGHVPCSNCARRRVACVYPTRNAATKLILVGRGKQKTATNWSLNEAESDSEPRRKSYLVPPGRLTDQTCNMSFFNAFTRTNNITGRVRTAGDEVKQLADLHSRKGNHLFNAILAVGATYAGKLNHQHVYSKREALSIAFQHYSYSVQGLREATDGMNLGTGPRLPRHQNQRVCILWTTFFLGLFEPEWVALSRDMWTDEENLAPGSKNTWTSLDSLLDIMYALFVVYLALPPLKQSMRRRCANFEAGRKQSYEDKTILKIYLHPMPWSYPKTDIVSEKH